VLASAHAYVWLLCEERIFLIGLYLMVAVMVLIKYMLCLRYNLELMFFFFFLRFACYTIYFAIVPLACVLSMMQ
jgi:hypothetical protein